MASVRPGDCIFTGFLLAEAALRIAQESVPLDRQDCLHVAVRLNGYRNSTNLRLLPISPLFLAVRGKQ